MAKLTARQIGLELDEHNKLEYDLSGDEHDREEWVLYQANLEADLYPPDGDWYDDDHFDDGYDPYPMYDYDDDLFDGEY